MLLRYVVSNYKSIGHRLEFSMFPLEENMDERFLTTITTRNGDWKLLRRGILFGPNASGKSAFIESVEFARDYIIDGQKSSRTTGVNGFRGGQSGQNGISTFQFMFYVNGEVYDYGFSLDRKQVWEEWLMILTSTEFAPVFTRKTDDMQKTEVEITSRLSRNGSKSREVAELLKETMKENQKNQLFLYKLYDNGVKRAESIVDWFGRIKTIFPGSKLQGLPIPVKEDEEFRNFLSEELKNLDTGVSAITAEGKEINFHDFADEMDLPKQLVEDVEDMKTGILCLNGRYYIFFEKQDRTILIQLKFEHLLNGKAVKFNIEDESDGTQRLLDLLPILFRVREGDSLYLIDELDRSLHTKLSRYFLQEFAEKSEETLSQMIVTAHDVSLIDLELLRKEEIWFLDKRSDGETYLKPFSDFTGVEGKDTIKDYLNGRFGAVPMIRGESGCPIRY